MSSEYMLGIETSCDDTSLALVSPEGSVVDCVTQTQAELNLRYGGVYPRMAARAHLDALVPVLDSLVERNPAEWNATTGIAVTRGPGLVGCLQVGVNFAIGLGRNTGLPVFGVNHLDGHVNSVSLDADPMKFPSVVLLVSGGHTLLAHALTPRDFRILGATIDDSVGEAFDKVARLLGLGFPGGRAVDELASQSNVAFAFPRPFLNTGLDFTFSGLKTSVRTAVQQGATPAPSICAGFVNSVVDVLVAKSKRAIDAVSASTLYVVGGVAASKPIRDGLRRMGADIGVEVCFPSLKYSTDNGAMIALAAWNDMRVDGAGAFRVEPRLRLGS